MSERAILASLASIFLVVLIAGLVSKRMPFMQAIHARDDDPTYYYIGAIFWTVAATACALAAFFS
jgi:hypothetical protein